MVQALTPVTDPNEIKQLESDNSNQNIGSLTPVTDPNELNNLNNIQPNAGISAPTTSIPYDILSSIAETPAKVLSGIEQIPSGVNNIGKFIENYGDLGAAKEFFGGMPIELGSDVANIPYHIGKYLKSKGYPALSNITNPLHISNEAKNKVIQEVTGIDPNAQGASTIRNLGTLIPLGKALSLAKTALGQSAILGASAIGAGQNPVQAILGAKILEKGGRMLGKGAGRLKTSYQTSKVNPDDLQAATNLAEQQEANANSELKTINAQLGSSSPEAAKVAQDNLQTKLENNQALLDTMHQNPNLFLGSNADEMKNLAKDRVNKAQGNLDEANQLQKNNLLVGQKYGAGHTYESAYGTGVNQDFEDLVKPYRQGYRDKHQEVTGLKIKVPLEGDEADQQDVLNDIEDTMGRSYIQNNPELKASSDALKQGQKVVPASDFIHLWKGARDAARVAENNSYARNIDGAERQMWKDKARKLQPIADKFRETLEQEFPEDTVAGLDDLDAQYKENVIPFYSSSAFRKIHFGDGKAPSNIINSIAGNEPGDIAMQNITKNNPELTKLALGQKYYKNPESMIGYDESVDPYIQSHSQIKNSLADQIHALSNLKNAKSLEDELNKFVPGQKVKEDIDNIVQKLQQNKILYAQQTAKINEIQDLGERFKKAKEAQEEYDKNNKALTNKMWSVLKGMGSYGLNYLGWHELFKTTKN